MNTLFRSFALAVVATLVGGSAFAGDAAKGKVAFTRNGCFQCHGFAAQGGAGPKLAPDTLPIEAFVGFVRTTRRAMPPYSEAILSNEDLADIHAYVSSLPPPPDYKTIDLLKQ